MSSSLTSAPALWKDAKANRDTNYDPPGTTYDGRPPKPASRSTSKDKKNSKKKKDKKLSSEANTKIDDNNEYSDDFEEETTLKPVKFSAVTSESNLNITAVDAELTVSKVAKEAKERYDEMEANLRRDREEHLKEVTAWNRQREEQMKREQQAKREDSENMQTRLNDILRASQAALEKQEAVYMKISEERTAMTEKMTQLMEQQLLAQQKQASEIGRAAMIAAEAQVNKRNTHQPEHESESAEEEEKDNNKEKNRRRRREKERDTDLRRLNEEEAAHSLFHRLAKDVREVFYELNLSVVAAEKERLLKDERYRKERDARDRREELERRERESKEMREREEREQKFWSLLEERERNHYLRMEHIAEKDEREREECVKRDQEEKNHRFQSDRELRDDLDRVDRERREREDNSFRERERVALQAQIDEIKHQYREQMEEMRRQSELDRANIHEVHKMELTNMEKRHSAAIALSEKHHREQLAMMDLHSANAGKLEQLIANSQTELLGTQHLVEKVMEERLANVRISEAQIEEQKNMVTKIKEEMEIMKGTLEKERQRLTSLYAKFDMSIVSFIRENEEERRKFRESHTHYETLRTQLEKDKKSMLHEIDQERKLLEKHHEQYISDKMQTMSEIQAERMAIMKERTEAAMAREKYNKDEAGLLMALRQKEEEYQCRLEAIASDRDAAQDLRREAQRLRDEASYEREHLRKERANFESEKDEVVMRVDDVRRKAEDAVLDQNRLRIALADERAMGMAQQYRSGKQGGYYPFADINGPIAATQLQIELSKQRAALTRLADNIV